MKLYHLQVTNKLTKDSYSVHVVATNRQEARLLAWTKFLMLKTKNNSKKHSDYKIDFV